MRKDEEGKRLGEAALFPGRRSPRGVERLGMSRFSRVRSARTRSTQSGRFSALSMSFDSERAVVRNQVVLDRGKLSDRYKSREND